MKKMILAIISLMVCLVATVAGQEVITGTVEIDGYSKITKGAFWATRPEAKMVYYGQTPSGVEVITLESNHFVRFAKGENNRFDINYIVFPKGEKVYIKNGEYFAAICGNKISFIQPVEKVDIREVKLVAETTTEPIVISSPISQNQDQWKTINPNLEKEEEPKIVLPDVVKKRSKIWKIIVPIISSAILVTAGYMVFKKDGGPGGAPLNNDPYIPPPPVVPTDGPGGAPLTK